MAAGLVGTVNGYTSPSFTHWIRLYNLTFIVGLSVGSFVFWALNYLFPVPGIGQEKPFFDESADVTSDSQETKGAGNSTAQGSAPSLSRNGNRQCNFSLR